VTSLYTSTCFILETTTYIVHHFCYDTCWRVVTGLSLASCTGLWDRVCTCLEFLRLLHLPTFLTVLYWPTQHCGTLVKDTAGHLGMLQGRSELMRFRFPLIRQPTSACHSFGVSVLVTHFAWRYACAVSEYPLSAACCVSRVCNALELKWGDPMTRGQLGQGDTAQGQPGQRGSGGRVTRAQGQLGKRESWAGGRWHMRPWGRWTRHRGSRGRGPGTGQPAQGAHGTGPAGAGWQAQGHLGQGEDGTWGDGAW